MATKVKSKSTTICYCVRDSREYPSDRFFQHPNTDNFPSGFVPFCKDCCNDMIKYYLQRTETMESALWYTCARLDMPFIKKVYESALKAYNNASKTQLEDNTIINYYYNYLWGTKSRKTALDKWESFADSDVDFKDIKAVVKSDENIKAQKEELQLNWGIQESEDDYKFLTYLYNKYTKNINIENPQQEDLYRDLCLARLEKRKVEEGKLETDLTKVQSRILTLMNKLKLDDFESTKPKSLSEQLMFAKIAQIELTKPCDLYREPKKYKDFNKVRKYYQDICLRALKNTLAGTRDFDIDMDNLQDYQLEVEGEENETDKEAN